MNTSSRARALLLAAIICGTLGCDSDDDWYDDEYINDTTVVEEEEEEEEEEEVRELPGIDPGPESP
jgi:hypothetical protein